VFQTFLAKALSINIYQNIFLRSIRTIRTEQRVKKLTVPLLFVPECAVAKSKTQNQQNIGMFIKKGLGQYLLGI
jgi:hypothetical protein